LKASVVRARASPVQPTGMPALKSKSSNAGNMSQIPSIASS